MTQRSAAVWWLLGLAVSLFGCGDLVTEEKPLAVRLYEHRLKRCTAMMPRDEGHRCVPAAGATYKDGLTFLHRAMVDQVAVVFPTQGTCTHHGVYLHCSERLLDGKHQRDVLYKLEDAKDHDGKVMYVWSNDFGD